MTHRAVESLIMHVLDNQIIPRINRLGEDCEYKGSSLAFYTALRANQAVASLSVTDIAAKTLGALKKSFFSLPPEVLKDMIGDVINSTIQSQTNAYRKVKKSTFGFWEETFCLNPDVSRFDVAFPHVFFKAIQTLLKSVDIRKGHETEDIESDDGKWSYISSYPDERNETEQRDTMAGYELKILEIKESVMNHPDLDWLAKRVFEVWFNLKETKLEFDRQVRMSSEVYPVVQLEFLEKEGHSISQVSLHMRWKKVLNIIRDCLT